MSLLARLSSSTRRCSSALTVCSSSLMDCSSSFDVSSSSLEDCSSSFIEDSSSLLERSSSFEDSSSSVVVCNRSLASRSSASSWRTPALSVRSATDSELALCERADRPYLLEYHQEQRVRRRLVLPQRLDMEVDVLMAAIGAHRYVGLRRGSAACHRLVDRRAKVEPKPRAGHAEHVDVRGAVRKLQIPAGPPRSMHQVALGVDDDVRGRVAVEEIRSAVLSRLGCTAERGSPAGPRRGLGGTSGNSGVRRSVCGRRLKMRCALSMVVNRWPCLVMFSDVPKRR